MWFLSGLTFVSLVLLKLFCSVSAAVLQEDRMTFNDFGTIFRMELLEMNRSFVDLEKYWKMGVRERQQTESKKTRVSHSVSHTVIDQRGVGTR